MNLWFVHLFVALSPFGMLQEFEKLGGPLVWLSVPFSALAAWTFTTMEKIGESRETPFEGSPNDVAVTAMSRALVDCPECHARVDGEEFGTAVSFLPGGLWQHSRSSSVA